MSSFKISPDVIEGLAILTINNKHARSTFILQYILRVLASSISIPYYFFCLKVENLDANNKNNESEAEIKIELKDKIN